MHSPLCPPLIDTDKIVASMLIWTPIMSMNSILRIAQIRILPEKGNMAANYEQLMSTLKGIKKGTADMVLTPECFLDGYVATEESVDSDGLRKHSVDPSDHPYIRANRC